MLWVLKRTISDHLNRYIRKYSNLCENLVKIKRMLSINEFLMSFPVFIWLFFFIKVYLHFQWILIVLQWLKTSWYTDICQINELICMWNTFQTVNSFASRGPRPGLKIDRTWSRSKLFYTLKKDDFEKQFAENKIMNDNQIRTYYHITCNFLLANVLVILIYRSPRFHCPNTSC